MCCIPHRPPAGIVHSDERPHGTQVSGYYNHAYYTGTLVLRPYGELVNYPIRYMGGWVEVLDVSCGTPIDRVPERGTPYIRPAPGYHIEQCIHGIEYRKGTV